METLGGGWASESLTMVVDDVPLFCVSQKTVWEIWNNQSDCENNPTGSGPTACEYPTKTNESLGKQNLTKTGELGVKQTSGSIAYSKVTGYRPEEPHIPFSHLMHRFACVRQDFRKTDRIEHPNKRVWC